MNRIETDVAVVRRKEKAFWMLAEAESYGGEGYLSVWEEKGEESLISGWQGLL